MFLYFSSHTVLLDKSSLNHQIVPLILLKFLRNAVNYCIYPFTEISQVANEQLSGDFYFVHWIFLCLISHKNEEATAQGAIGTRRLGHDPGWTQTPVTMSTTAFIRSTATIVGFGDLVSRELLCNCYSVLSAVSLYDYMFVGFSYIKSFFAVF